ncbi:DUF2321 domain-containing protein [Cytobacillus firmus]|uniref:DUF2321 domain-containing protein n=1 Tax=Cytobacillus firmus TaxID=1399 RepID=UPI0028973867|nr:DUF2321 domain-containing protein [Cytobacillus firmus]
MESYYDIAQICKNGHLITDSFNESPQRRANHCSVCGEQTINCCSSCKASIRGEYNVPGVAVIGFSYDIPSFCHGCGAAYPWTQEKLEAAKELADLLDELTEEEQESLKKSLDELVKDGPRTVVATTKFKRILSKTGPEIATGFKDILIDVVSETVKKTIWG